MRYSELPKDVQKVIYELVRVAERAEREITTNTIQKDTVLDNGVASLSLVDDLDATLGLCGTIMDDKMHLDKFLTEFADKFL